MQQQVSLNSAVPVSVPLTCFENNLLTPKIRFGHKQEYLMRYYSVMDLVVVLYTILCVIYRTKTISLEIKLSQNCISLCMELFSSFLICSCAYVGYVHHIYNYIK